MGKKGWKTAAEVVQEHMADPEYRRKREEQDRKSEMAAREFRAAEAELQAKLREHGCELEPLENYLPKKSKLSANQADVLLQHLTEIENESVLTVAIYALRTAPRPIDGRHLAELFDVTKHHNLRWVIADLMSQTKVKNIDEWMLSAVLDRRNAESRQMLALAIAKNIDASWAIPILLCVIKDLPGHVAAAFRKCGDESVLPQLAQALDGARPWEKKSIRSAIKAIEKRAT